MTVKAERTTTDRLFRVAIALKGLDGGTQLLAGIALLFIPARAIADLAQVVVTRDLLGSGEMASHVQSAAQSFAGGGTHTFVIVYLLAHGVIKVGLVIALVRQIVPMYPIAAAALAVFVGFEALRALQTHSIVLPIFALLDVLIIALVIKEYLQLRRQRAAGQQHST